MSMSVTRRRRAAAMLSVATLLGGMLVGLVGTPAYAADLGTVSLSQTSGSVTDSPMFATGITSVPCPTGFGEEAALRIGPAETGPFTNLTPSLGGGGYDKAPVVADPNRSFQLALGSAPANGRWWVVVECFSLLEGRHPNRFVTPIEVTGDQWRVVSTAVATTTSLTASPENSAAEGATVTLTATVNPPTATGSIQFQSDGSPIGAPVALAGGSATLAVADLAVGMRSLVAVYQPTGNFAGSISSAMTYQINSATGVSTVTRLAVSPEGPQDPGTPITLTATVEPAEAEGVVQFRDGTANLGIELNVTGGTVTTTVNTTQSGLLAPGAHSFSAIFTPVDAAAFNGSQSEAVSYEITGEGAAVTTTELTIAPAGPRPQGSSVTLTARVRPEAAIGSIRFEDGSTPLGAPVQLQNGVASISTTTLPVGTRSLKAVYVSGDTTRFLGSESAPQSYVITAPASSGDDLTVTDENGVELGPNPTLQRGQVVNLVARGFDGNETVTVRFDDELDDPETAENGVVR
ncbi:Ig-like domain-containing protein, partial [Micromonospora sp. NPDC051296]|uniref:Ig-like domain-containing protein n=1 Tax=Micromonospora sp. NPDC051296 TaxID=3155046 RepID=UPI003441AFDD